MPKKSLGQNFLNNEKILSDIIKCGDISKDDIILELDLELEILQKNNRKDPKLLIAVEKDKNLSISLKEKFGKNWR